MSDKIVFDSLSARHKDENGFLHVTRCHITKEQVVPYYGREIPGWRELGLDPEKMYNVYRPAAELEKGYATFNGLPLLLEHHPESAENPQTLHRVGSLGTDATWNPPYVDITLSVTDQRAIDAIEQGRFKELSAAYQYEPVLERGEFDGKPYDIVMKNIRGNHVALVREGRAGPDVVVADAKPRLTFASWYLDKFGKKVLTNRVLTMDCKNWLRQHLEAVKEVLPNEHRVFRDALRNREAFDDWYKQIGTTATRRKLGGDFL